MTTIKELSFAKKMKSIKNSQHKSFRRLYFSVWFLLKKEIDLFLKDKRIKKRDFTFENKEYKIYSLKTRLNGYYHLIIEKKENKIYQYKSSNVKLNIASTKELENIINSKTNFSINSLIEIQNSKAIINEIKIAVDKNIAEFIDYNMSFDFKDPKNNLEKTRKLFKNHLKKELEVGNKKRNDYIKRIITSIDKKIDKNQHRNMLSINKLRRIMISFFSNEFNSVIKYHYSNITNMDYEISLLKKIIKQNSNTQELIFFKRFGNPLNYINQLDKGMNRELLYSFLTKYPLFLSFFINHKSSNNKIETTMNEKMIKICKEGNSIEDLENIIKDYYEIDTEDLNYFVGLNWQLAKAFKNKPFYLIEIVKLIKEKELDIDLSEFKQRKDFTNLYYFYKFYYLNNTFILSNTKINKNIDFPDSPYDIYNKYKGILYKLKEELKKESYCSIAYSATTNMKFKIRDLNELLLFHRVQEQNMKNESFFKNECVIRDNIYEVIPITYNKYKFKSKNDEFNLMLIKYTEDEIDLKTTLKDEKKEIELRKLISKDLKRVLNKKYKTLEIIDRGAFFNLFKDNKNINSQVNNFFIWNIKNKKAKTVEENIFIRDTINYYAKDDLYDISMLDMIK